VGGSVRGKGRLLLMLEVGGESEPRLVFLAPLGDIAGKEAVHSPDQKSQSGHIKDDGHNGQRGGDVSQNVEHGAYEKQDQLKEKQGVVQIANGILENGEESYMARGF
jgi:hypothetical protein